MVSDTFNLKDSRALVDCAMGRTPADLVIRNAEWACVQTGEFIPHTEVAILQGRIAYVGEDASHTIGSKTQVINAEGRYLVPGLLDAHMHIESGMLTVTEFVRAVAVHGTTGMFVDPHEIANVFGLKGVKLMVDEAASQPVHVFVQVPSCVPSAPGFETPGATISVEDVVEALTWPGVIGLGEMMNFPGVYLDDPKVHAEMTATREAGKVIGGHYASPDLGLPFHGYVVGGPQDDHEGTRLADAVARARQGMRVMLRYGSAWHDVAAQAPAITRLGLDSHRFLLCTDDSMAETLVSQGHVDRVLRHAISEGIDPMVALQMATINTAEYFGVSREMGMIAPGRYADLVLTSDLRDFAAELVIAKGIITAREGEMVVDLPGVIYPEWVCNSVHLAREITQEDFKISANHFPTVQAHVIGIIENQAPTHHLVMTMTVENGEVCADTDQDIAKVALIDRHSGASQVHMGLVHGFGLEGKCAIASTVSHDCHHMMMIGTDENCMALAANTLRECGGGQVVVKDGVVIGKVELPIAGLMSNENARIVAKKAGTVLDGFRTCGCGLNNPNMQLSLLALVVIPELRISDHGLVDVSKFSVIEVLD